MRAGPGWLTALLLLAPAAVGQEELARADALRQEGIAAYDSGRIAEARDCFRRAAEAYEQALPPPEGQYRAAPMRRSVGFASLELEEWDAAADAALAAIPLAHLCEEIPDEHPRALRVREEARGLHQLVTAVAAELLERRGGAAAAAFWGRAADAHQKAGSLPAAARCRHNQAMVLAECAPLAEALAAFERTIDQLEALGDTAGVARSAGAGAACARRDGDVPAATRLLARGIAAALEGGHLDVEALLAEEWLDLRATAGSTPAARGDVLMALTEAAARPSVNAPPGAYFDRLWLAREAALQELLAGRLDRLPRLAEILESVTAPAAHPRPERLLAVCLRAIGRVETDGPAAAAPLPPLREELVRQGDPRTACAVQVGLGAALAAEGATSEAGRALLEAFAQAARVPDPAFASAARARMRVALGEERAAALGADPPRPAARIHPWRIPREELEALASSRPRLTVYEVHPAPEQGNVRVVLLPGGEPRSWTVPAEEGTVTVLRVPGLTLVAAGRWVASAGIQRDPAPPEEEPSSIDAFPWGVPSVLVKPGGKASITRIGGVRS